MEFFSAALASWHDLYQKKESEEVVKETEESHVGKLGQDVLAFPRCHHIFTTFKSCDILSESQICEYQMTLFVKEDVVWFDVTVHDAYFVETLDSKHLQGDRFMRN